MHTFRRATTLLRKVFLETRFPGQKILDLQIVIFLNTDKSRLHVKFEVDETSMYRLWHQAIKTVAQIWTFLERLMHFVFNFEQC